MVAINRHQARQDKVGRALSITWGRFSCRVAILRRMTFPGRAGEIVSARDIPSPIHGRHEASSTTSRVAASSSRRTCSEGVEARALFPRRVSIPVLVPAFFLALRLTQTPRQILPMLQICRPLVSSGSALRTPRGCCARLPSPKNPWTELYAWRGWY